MPRKEKQLHLAEGKEAGNWKPHTWEVERKQKFISDVLKHSLRAVCEGKKSFQENEITALVRGDMLGLVSYAMLKAAGIETLGERGQ